MDHTAQILDSPSPDRLHALKEMARVQTASDAEELGAPLAGDFLPGQQLEQPVSFQPGACYTVLASAASTVTGFTLEILAAHDVPGMSPVLASATSRGNEAALAAYPRCYRWPFPIGGQLLIVTRVTEGHGEIVTQLYQVPYQSATSLEEDAKQSLSTTQSLPSAPGAAMPLYHYTTLGALMSILRTAKLWATDCRFMNDGTELTYAKRLFDDQVKLLDLPPVEGGGRRLPFDEHSMWRVYVSCFCPDGDLLGQWRGYGPDNGYAICFAPDAWDITVRPVPVRYGLEDPVAYFENELEAAKHITAHPGVAGHHATEALLPRLAAVKHPSFKDEKEHRLIVRNYVGELATESWTGGF